MDATDSLEVTATGSLEGVDLEELESASVAVAAAAAAEVSDPLSAVMDVDSEADPDLANEASEKGVASDDEDDMSS